MNIKLPHNQIFYRDGAYGAMWQNANNGLPSMAKNGIKVVLYNTDNTSTREYTRSNSAWYYIDMVAA